MGDSLTSVTIMDYNANTYLSAALKALWDQVCAVCGISLWHLVLLWRSDTSRL